MQQALSLEALIAKSRNLVSVGTCEKSVVVKISEITLDVISKSLRDLASPQVSDPIFYYLAFFFPSQTIVQSIQSPFMCSFT